MSKLIIKYSLFLLLISGGLIGTAYSQQSIVPTSPSVRSIYQKGLGGAFVAVANDHYLMWSNPAGLARKKGFTGSTGSYSLLQFLPIHIGISQSGVNLLTNLNRYSEQLKVGDSTTNGGNSSPLKSIEDFLDLAKELDRQQIGFFSQLPIAFTWVARDFGFSIVSYLGLNAGLISGLLPAINVNLTVGGEVKLGLSPFKFSILSPNDLVVGFNVKGLGFGTINSIIDPATIVSFIGKKGFDADKILQYISNNTVNFYGGGVDVGALYDYGDFAFGLSIIDLTTIGATIIPVEKNGKITTTTKFAILFPNIKTGVAYHMPYRIPVVGDWLFTEPIVSVEIDNWFNPNYFTIGNHLHAGVSVNLIDVGWFGLNFAVGVNKGYGTASVIAKLPLALFISYAFYQDELSGRGNTIAYSEHLGEIVFRF